MHGRHASPDVSRRPCEQETCRDAASVLVVDMALRMAQALTQLASLLPERLCQHDEAVAVGWSGGADSTALLLALRQRGMHVSAWHVDHGWRRESLAEASRLEALAQNWRIPFYSARVQAADSNREHEARQARYACFSRWAREQGVHHLYLAHHAADQAETVCMRLLQGAGVFGCRGMAAERQHDGVLIHRPWLRVDPVYLRQLLRQAQVDWFEDPSNRDCSLWRNAVRQRLFPAMQAAGRDPHVLFLRWQQQAVRIAREVEQAALEVPLDDMAGEVRVPWSVWLRLSNSVRVFVLQRMVSMLFGEGVCAGRRHIRLVETWTAQGGHGGVDLSRCRLERKKSYLHLRRTRAMLR